MTPSLFSIVGIYTYGNRKLSDQKPFLTLNYSQERRLRKEIESTKRLLLLQALGGRRLPAARNQELRGSVSATHG
jgi:hypothetical protein